MLAWKGISGALKGVLGIEIVALAGAYGIFHGLNTSPSFRVRCHEWAPFIVIGFYQIAETVNPAAAEQAR
jgi:hypothetical protein